MSLDREALHRRRLELQQRILRERQRGYIAGVLEELDSTGDAYELIWPGDPSNRGWNWIASRFPMGYARVEWKRVPAAECKRWGTDEERAQRFLQLLASHASREDELLVVVWGNAAKPSLVLSASAVRRHCRLLLEWDFDLWVYSPEATWLLECYHEGELCVGAA